MVLKKCRIFLVSDLDENFVKSIFLEPFSSVDEALKEAFSSLGQDSTVMFMPHGGSVLPQAEESFSCRRESGEKHKE